MSDNGSAKCLSTMLGKWGAGGRSTGVLDWRMDVWYKSKNPENPTGSDEPMKQRLSI